MSDALYARAWVFTLGGAAAGLTLASLARAEIVLDTPAAPLLELNTPSPGAGEPLPEGPTLPDLSPPSQVPSDPVGTAGSGASIAGEGSVEGAAVVAAADPPTVDLAGATPIVVPPIATPTDVPAAATRVATDDAPCAFVLQRNQLTRSIVDQRPAPATSPFEADGRTLYLWVETNNMEGRGPQAIFRWVHEASDYVAGTRLDLAISARWRTWTSVELPPTLFGPWRVEVLDHEGCQVDVLRFEMLPRGW